MKPSWLKAKWRNQSRWKWSTSPDNTFEAGKSHLQKFKLILKYLTTRDR